MRFRTTFGLWALAAMSATTPRTQSTVDVMTFIAAFEAGNATKYIGAVVRGSGQNFHGMSAARPTPGKPQEFAQTVTIGAMTADHKVAKIVTKDEFLAADRDERTVAIWLTGPGVPRGATANLPQPVEFIGSYHGVGKWMPRSQPHSKYERSNPGGVCLGEPPVTMAKVPGSQEPKLVTAFYCVPVLENATVK